MSSRDKRGSRRGRRTSSRVSSRKGTRKRETTNVSQHDDDSDSDLPEIVECSSSDSSDSEDTIPTSYRKSRRKRKPAIQFEPTQKLRTRASATNVKAKRRKSGKTKSKTKNKRRKSCKTNCKTLSSFFSPRSKEISKATPRSKTKVQVPRRLRSAAPIYELIDTIQRNHPNNLKDLNTETYVCKCGASFTTKSYKRSNFEAHLKRDAQLAAKSPWSTAAKALSAEPVTLTPFAQQSSNICHTVVDGNGLQEEWAQLPCIQKRVVNCMLE